MSAALAKLIGEVILAIVNAPDPKEAARRAAVAASNKAFDEAMRARRAKR